jgi:hypothetical protein
VSTSGTKPEDEIPIYDMSSLFDQSNQEQSSDKVSNLRNLLGSCVKLLNDKNSLQILQNLLEKCNSGEEWVKRINHICKKRRTSREFKLNASIGDFNMGDIILDLGSEVNVLPKKTWEAMGEPQMGYSPIQLKLENQHKVVPIDRLKGILVDLDGVRTMEDFEVIDIVENTSPYPTLLGLDWPFDNQDIINLKTINMIFESGKYIFILPLYPSEGGRYVEPATENILTEDVNQLYRTTVHEEDYVNPIVDGILSWRSISSCAYNTGLEKWQKRLCELSTRRCTRMTCAH